MQFNFDLISDLHCESWDSFDWTGQATSPYCIVAGDVAKDHNIVKDVLTHLGQCYQGVFYIDGNEEHRYNLEDIGSSYASLSASIKNIKNVVYLQDQVVIINGVAILGTNGWWSFDFDPGLDYDQSRLWYQENRQISNNASCVPPGLAFNDALYLSNSIKKLQTHQDVRAIVLVSHTVPDPELIMHDIEMVDTWRFNSTGNRHLLMALNEDTEHKVKVWCFGHYHKSVDRHIDGIDYINNCRGRGNTPWCQQAYYPRRITVNF
jgi:predicted phosphohydrolase